MASVDRDLVLKPSCGERGSGFAHVSRSGVLSDGHGTEIARHAVTERVFGYRHRRGCYGYIAQPALAPDLAMVRLTGIDALVTARIVTAVEIACRAAVAYPRTATLGWDIAMTSAGCVIVDGNPNWGSGRRLRWREGVRPTFARMFAEYFR